MCTHVNARGGCRQDPKNQQKMVRASRRGTFGSYKGGVPWKPDCCLVRLSSILASSHCRASAARKSKWLIRTLSRTDRRPTALLLSFLQPSAPFFRVSTSKASSTQQLLSPTCSLPHLFSLPSLFSPLLPTTMLLLVGLIALAIPSSSITLLYAYQTQEPAPFDSFSLVCKC
jgi:hypothetical protein